MYHHIRGSSRVEWAQWTAGPHKNIACMYVYLCIISCQTSTTLVGDVVDIMTLWLPLTHLVCGDYSTSLLSLATGPVHKCLSSLSFFSLLLGLFDVDLKKIAQTLKCKCGVSIRHVNRWLELRLYVVSLQFTPEIINNMAPTGSNSTVRSKLAHFPWLYQHLLTMQ